MKSRLHAHIGTIRQLEILLALHHQGSIKKAAESLFLTQPTVSMQLKKLSDAIDMPLYQVVGKKIHFTEAGNELVATANEVISSFSRLDMSLANLKGLKAGTLHLAVVTTSKYFIPHLLGPFCEQHPHIDVQLKVGNREQIMERLRQGEDDFYVFSHPPQDMKINHFEFLTNPLVAIAPENHPLAKRRSISLKSIEGESFIMREQGSGTRLAIEDFCEKHGFKLNIRMIIESNEAIKHSVMSGLGISILSAHTLVYGGSAGLAQLPVNELPIKTHWYFCWLKRKEPSVLGKAFLRHVETEGRAMLISELQRSGVKWRDI